MGWDTSVSTSWNEEVIRHLRRPGHLAGSVEAQHEEVHHQAVVLHDEGGELQTSHYSIRVGVVHVLVVDDNVVLGRHVVSNIVVNDEPEESVEKCEINLLIELLKLALHHDVALPLNLKTVKFFSILVKLARKAIQI